VFSGLLPVIGGVFTGGCLPHALFFTSPVGQPNLVNDKRKVNDVQ